MPDVDLGIEGFENIHVIGSGGQATVYLARDLHHQREVAVKIFESDADPELFDRERKATGLLSTHENVVHLHRSGTTAAGYSFLMMEYADSGSLADHVFGWEQAVEILTDVARALEAAHKRGVIHRDVKPQNILLFSATDGGLRGKLADFGIASVPGTKTTTVLRGSTAYAPPEFLGQGQKTNERGDIYSLGATAFSALTGEIPPQGGAAAAVQERAKGSPIKPIWDAVATAMAGDPADRFATAEDFREALTSAAQQLQQSANVVTVEEEEAKPLPDIAPGRPAPDVGPNHPAPDLGPAPDPDIGPSAPAAPPTRSPLWKVPMRLDSTRNIAGLSGGLLTAGLVLTGMLDPTFLSGIFLVPVGYVAGVLVSHGFDQD